jgi:hypothetical protein
MYCQLSAVLPTDRRFSVIFAIASIGVHINSKKFSPAEKNYTTTEHDLQGVLHALQSLRCYLEGCVGLTGW